MSPDCDTALERLDLSLETYLALTGEEVDAVADLLVMDVREIARVFRGRRASLDELRRELAGSLVLVPLSILTVHR